MSRLTFALRDFLRAVAASVRYTRYPARCGGLRRTVAPRNSMLRLIGALVPCHTVARKRSNLLVSVNTFPARKLGYMRSLA